MQIDIRTTADMAGQSAADKPRAEGIQNPHHAEGLQTHFAKVFRPLLTFLELGPNLNLVADFAVAGQIAWLEVASRDAAGCFEFCAEVFGFFALVHQPAGIPSHLATKLVARHPLVPYISGARY